MSEGILFAMLEWDFITCTVLSILIFSFLILMPHKTPTRYVSRPSSRVSSLSNNSSFPW